MKSLEFIKLQDLAKGFLQIADTFNEKVSNYINGSDAEEDANAYALVKHADRVFTAAYNKYYDENNEACLNYDLAESILY